MIKDRYGNNVGKEDIKEVLKSIVNGADTYGLREALVIRAIDENEVTHGLVHIIPFNELSEITGIKYDGASQLPYFGAVTTEEGKRWLREN